MIGPAGAHEAGHKTPCYPCAAGAENAILGSGSAPKTGPSEVKKFFQNGGALLTLARMRHYTSSQWLGGGGGFSPGRVGRGPRAGLLTREADEEESYGRCKEEDQHEQGEEEGPGQEEGRCEEEEVAPWDRLGPATARHARQETSVFVSGGSEGSIEPRERPRGRDCRGPFSFQTGESPSRPSARRRR